MPQTFSFSKTRIAPTPSGYLHAGNALNFLLTSALAKRYGASLLLRIDDLDRERYRRAYAEDVFATLHFLDIQWNEGPQDLADFEERWSQQTRMKFYEGALSKLREANLVFACTCSRTQVVECRCRDKQLSLDAPATSWRLITDDKPIAIKSIDGSTKTAFLPAEMRNFVVRKKDGQPAYQLASLIDDLHFNIDFIVRGEDLWSSTIAQLYLAKQLSEEKFFAVHFYHHPLLKAANGEKLSKSAGDTSVKHWREVGKTREEFLACIGEAFGVKVESVNELTEFLRI